MSKPAFAERIDVVLPAHNEGESIGATLREFHDVVGKQCGYKIRFVVCEDGSKDNTVEVLQNLSRELPIKLISEKGRKGYSRAVVDGFRASDAPYVAFIDSDGQCDPRDFHPLAEKMADNDLAYGYRNPRVDHWVRLLMSGCFRAVYRLFFSVPFRDPSCPFLIVRQSALRRLLTPTLGILPQGFWWEFTARAVANGLRCVEAPVAHRPRASGTTQVYRPTKVPRIAWVHLVGLFRLKRELRGKATEMPVPATESQRRAG